MKTQSPLPTTLFVAFSVPFLKYLWLTTPVFILLPSRRNRNSSECYAHITIVYIIFPYLFDLNNYQIMLKWRQDNPEERMHDRDGAQKSPTAASVHWPAAQPWTLLLGMWKKHRVIRSFTVTVIGQSAISSHSLDYVHDTQKCHVTPLTIKSKSFDNGAKSNDCPLEVCNPRLL